MKYKDKAGQVYDDLTAAVRTWCHAQHEACEKCPIGLLKGKAFCQDWVNTCPTIVAQICGLEAVKEEPTILDSGNRREFSTGAVRDIQIGKGRMDLLPWAAVMEVSKHCENGAIKYGEHNVDKGIPTHSLCDSASRHLAKYLDGWTDEPHLLAATWNLLWAVQMTIKHPELVDTPWEANHEEQPTSPN